MNASAENFDQIVNDRRSVRIFEAQAGFDPQAVHRSIERAILSPNSSNMQLWEFYRINSKDKLEKMAPICMGQNAAKTARELVVIIARPDLWRKRQRANLAEMKRIYSDRNDKQAKRALRYYSTIMPRYYFNDFLGIWGFLKKCIFFFYGLKKPFIRHGNATDIRISVHKSAALAAQTFMLSMKAEGYDTCPMEGVDSLRVKKLLKLPRKAEMVMVIGCGPGSEKGIYSDRFRIPNEEVVFQI